MLRERYRTGTVISFVLISYLRTGKKLVVGFNFETRVVRSMAEHVERTENTKR